MMESDYIFKGQQNIPIPFIEPITCTTFSRRPIDVLLAEYKLNELLFKAGEASLYDFFESLDIEMDEKLEEDAKDLGWNIECNCVCTRPDGPWINFSHPDFKFLNDSYIKVKMDPLPCVSYLKCMDWGCAY